MSIKTKIPDTFAPKFKKRTKVYICRDFEGFCGLGEIINVHRAGLTPYYDCKLLKGSYMGKEAPLICCVSEWNLKEE